MSSHAGEPAPLTLADYAARARTRLAPGVWDFVAGGAGDERTLAANTAAFDRVRLRPRVLTGVGRPDLATRVLGREWAAPIGVAPMGYHTLVHPDGEVATAAAAGAAGLPLVVSTFAGRTVEDIAAVAGAPLWLQVYCFRDRDTIRALIERAERAGVEALVLTADAPRLGRRLRDLRGGFRLPPEITPANLTGTGFDSPADHALQAFDTELDWTVVAWLRTVSALPVLIKGVLTADDARRAVASGAAGLVVSNHGGRQLDGVSAALEALPEIAAAVAGRVPVLLDGGVRRGVDVLAALALGADAVLLGRPVLHGLAVDGRDGVADVLGIVTEELRDAMALAGVSSAADAGPELVAGAEVRELPPLTSTGSSVSPTDPPVASGALAREDLHASVSDPVLDTMNFLNEITHRYPDAVSFAPGRPYDGFFDPEDIFGHIRRYMQHLDKAGYSPERIRDALFQYGPTGGQIRELVADSLRLDEQIEVAPEAIVVTVGAQEAMLLTLRALIAGPEDVLLVSSPCYVGITGAARLLDIETVAVEEGPDGFRCADLEAAVAAQRARGRRPRAFYVIPDHSNPSGATMSAAERQALLHLAAREDILVLEDSPYRLVSPGAQLPTLKALDRKRRVVQLGSFAKSLFPGARVGYVVADQTVVDRAGGTGLLADELTRIKSMVTVNTSPLSQAAVAGMLLSAGGGAAALNADTAAHYGAAMEATLEQLEVFLPEPERTALGVRWNRPSGGFFLTVTVPFTADNAALARSAEEFGVIWTPMSYFYPQGGGEHVLRLSISYLTHADIREGIARLARFITDSARL
ncbi:(S)-3,5-dihydroxyphenylglycine transaminase [Streptomyces sp. SAI-135]|uniref:aminotransferase class I/II-fold pyridoxal phosphate-dependent enzyme n=1 Tax=unclassified Streptomyces TaxID=2593676 RepID=UPI0024761850|nr:MULTISPECIES: aminotransferase class I/II-fold pyridoxal phosphate-dependent enzyme [unclassified Streptomyces]MDH6521533.1 (S)-3,5-dihydroxyphenylglycine transaminase [Streptomyces sp. SAI-090]MDH6614369.1 (S)-3,5-dihydroxyphenylglycine transaminase [Streptomyces sp. SAI-135]